MAKPDSVEDSTQDPLNFPRLRLHGKVSTTTGSGLAPVCSPSPTLVTDQFSEEFGNPGLGPALQKVRPNAENGENGSCLGCSPHSNLVVRLNNGLNALDLGPLPRGSMGCSNPKLECGVGCSSRKKERGLTLIELIVVAERPWNRRVKVSITMSQKRLQDKVAIITGGASGIGASAVHVFHENGAKVVIADIQDIQGQAIADKLGENVCFIHCDVSNEDDIRNLIDTTVSKHGKLDIMYNNAGIMDRPTIGGILDAKKSDLEKMFEVNLIGSFLGAKHAARVMIPQRKGCILFTASACTSIAGLASHSYAATKYAILGLAKNLTPDLGQYGIRVNCISPYGVVTGVPGITVEHRSIVELKLSNMGNLKGEILKPECIAKAALYLASDEANYVSGLNLLVDGGYSVVNPTMFKFANLVN
ncbi:hypothetical protein V6N11_021158 [Hibiscus sabdariffa]|uniref:Tropinone reductase-like 1 n=1 Tax=Hibiscus sabdariffa TaxID=183260 RepID=A0ABR2AHN9_9ROSI